MDAAHFGVPSHPVDGFTEALQQIDNLMEPFQLVN